MIWFKTLCQWQSPKINPSVITYYPFFLIGNAKIFTTFCHLKQWYLRSILAIACGSLATYSIYAPNLGLEYAVWHPIWHSCIFTTAFMATSMRHSFDKEILDNPDYTRAASDSI